MRLVDRVNGLLSNKVTDVQKTAYMVATLVKKTRHPQSEQKAQKVLKLVTNLDKAVGELLVSLGDIPEVTASTIPDLIKRID